MSHRVLVADPDRALQVLLKVILSRAGFDVDFANNGPEALRKAIGDSYDAIMLDLMMPGIPGTEILERLKRQKPDSLKKVIVITGANHSLVEQVDTKQIHALLRKPFDIQDVMRLTLECANGS